MQRKSIDVKGALRMTITQREREHLLTAKNALLDAEESLDKIILAFDTIDSSDLDSLPFAEAKWLSLKVRADITKRLKLPVLEVKQGSKE